MREGFTTGPNTGELARRAVGPAGGVSADTTFIDNEVEGGCPCAVPGVATREFGLAEPFFFLLKRKHIPWRSTLERGSKYTRSVCWRSISEREPKCTIASAVGVFAVVGGSATQHSL